MCVHREHRTGNCRECQPFATGGIVKAHEGLQLIGGEGTDCTIPHPRPAMPLLWSDEGDDL